jgi:hypothetical protein
MVLSLMLILQMARQYVYGAGAITAPSYFLVWENGWLCTFQPLFSFPGSAGPRGRYMYVLDVRKGCAATTMLALGTQWRECPKPRGIHPEKVSAQAAIEAIQKYDTKSFKSTVFVFSDTIQASQSHSFSSDPVSQVTWGWRRSPLTSRYFNDNGDSCNDRAFNAYWTSLGCTCKDIAHQCVYTLTNSSYRSQREANTDSVLVIS